jgi:putative restriction endonuclease
MPAHREQLANDFTWRRQRFPLIDPQRGIRRPAGWAAALSIVTVVARSGARRSLAHNQCVTRSACSE